MEDTTTHSFTVQLTVSQIDGDLFVVCSFTNVTEYIHYLEPSKLPDVSGILTSDVFRFEPNAIYLGPQIKREPVSEADLIAVPPGGHFDTSRVNLTEYYADIFQHSDVRYYAVHKTSRSGNATLEVVESEAVRIEKAGS